MRRDEELITSDIPKSLILYTPATLLLFRRWAASLLSLGLLESTSEMAESTFESSVEPAAMVVKVAGGWTALLEVYWSFKMKRDGCTGVGFDFEDQEQALSD